MTKRIFRSICFAAIAVFIASVFLFSFVLYDYFSDVRASQLKVQTELCAHAVAKEGLSYFDGLDTSEYRISWIAPDGEVIFDSAKSPEEMENHLEREEIQNALKYGYGSSSRYSITLMERALYSAQRLPDGSVIRLSVSQNTLLTLFLGMSQPLAIILLAAILLSMLLASRLSKQIVKPLNSLNLDEPLSNDGYDELSPLLRRIDSQQRQIRNQAEKLAQKQQEFEAVTENMVEGIILLNAEGIVLGINRAALELFGADRSCIGSHIFSIDRSSAVSELVSESKKGHRCERMSEIKGRRYQLTLSPVISEDKPSGSVILAVDVTEKEKGEQMRREFTANVSHELKTPLHIISGSAELLMNGLVKEDDKQKFYQSIRSEADRMTRLVEDIIRLSHLDEGAEDMKWEKTDLYNLAAQTVNSLSEEAKRAGIKISLSGSETFVFGIPQLLSIVIYNLCDNAIKYNRSGGSVDVKVENSGQKAILTVSDTGIGIPLEHQERIFERFYRVDKSRSKELGGTGLGLSIVKHAAMIHKAEIKLESTPGKGTKITLEFPVEQSGSILEDVK